MGIFPQNISKRKINANKKNDKYGIFNWCTKVDELLNYIVVETNAINEKY